MTDATATLTIGFHLPDLGEGVAETEIIRWLVGVGDTVAEDQGMVEVMTDKATVEIPAPASGTIAAIHAEAGAVVPVGTLIVEIAGSGAGVQSNRPVNAPSRPAAPAAAPGVGAVAPAAPAASSGRVQATPLVRKLAAELGVDLATVQGSGPGGRITESDVRTAMRHEAAPLAPDTGSMPREGVLRCIPLVGMRRQIATQLARSQQVPTVTVVEECDLTAVEAARKPTGHSLLTHVVKAVEAAIAEVPEFNAHLDGERQEVVVYERIDLGIAVQSDDGLVVPVLRDVPSLDLEGVERGIAALADGARRGSLTPQQLRGSTLTITSAGKLGGLFTTPLLNLPEVAILGVHRAEDRAVVRDGEVVVRRMANLSITFDHRANDGLAASRFLLAVIAALQAPAA